MPRLDIGAMSADRVRMTPRMRLNFQLVDLSDADPTESLLRWLRRQRLTGTKEGCGDGDCGACTVALVETSDDGKARFSAINACLMPMGAMVGREVVTVESLAIGEVLHPVQQAMVDHAGSQCGYCTPGFVMSLFCGYYAGDFDDHVIDGNLCRCTGYLPIRRAAKALAAEPRGADRFSALLDQHQAPETTSLGTFHNPDNIADALALKVAHHAAWIASGTDLGVALSRGQHIASVLIAIDRIPELQCLSIHDNHARIGAGVPLSRLERELVGVFPALDHLLPWFAARQIKNRASLGGNLGSASPIGDLLPWLLAQDATIEVRGPMGARELAVDGFFEGYRQTALQPDELIVAVRVPRVRGMQAGYKVAKRRGDDISIVAAVFVLVLDDDCRIAHVRLAYGGVAAVPIRAKAVEAWLLGRALDESVLQEAVARLRAEFTPLDDHRASAEYRRALVGNLFAQFVAEHKEAP